MCLPRGIPAASLKLERRQRPDNRAVESSAGNTRGLIEAMMETHLSIHRVASSAGNTRGLIEAAATPWPPTFVLMSSAGNTRGLIEA